MFLKELILSRQAIEIRHKLVYFSESVHMLLIGIMAGFLFKKKRH